MSERLLTTKEAAELLGLTPHTLEQYRWKGIGPKYLKAPGKPGVTTGLGSGLVRYREQDLWEWLGEPQVSTRKDIASV
jgi:predicted DNA-binding transcriptional regulator AlpA